MVEGAIAHRTRARTKRKSLSPARQNGTPHRPTPRRRARRKLTSVVQSESAEDVVADTETGRPAAEGYIVDKDEADSLLGRRREAPGGQRMAQREPSPAPSTSDSDVVIVEERQAGQQAHDSDDILVSEPRVQQKRQGDAGRTSGGTAKLTAADKNDQDDDGLESDEELKIVGMVGQVVTRDLPHPRPDCAEHRFVNVAGGAEANARHCAQCFCYVCDVKASECRFWGTGRRDRDHANARQLATWNSLRAAARAGNTALVKREFQASGPLRPPSPPSPPPRQRARARAPSPPPPPPPPLRPPPPSSTIAAAAGGGSVPHHRWGLEDEVTSRPSGALAQRPWQGRRGQPGLHDAMGLAGLDFFPGMAFQPMAGAAHGMASFEAELDWIFNQCGNPRGQSGSGMFPAPPRALPNPNLPPHLQYNQQRQYNPYQQANMQPYPQPFPQPFQQQPYYGQQQQQPHFGLQPPQQHRSRYPQDHFYALPHQQPEAYYQQAYPHQQFGQHFAQHAAAQSAVLQQQGYAQSGVQPPGMAPGLGAMAVQPPGAAAQPQADAAAPHGTYYGTA